MSSQRRANTELLRRKGLADAQPMSTQRSVKDAPHIKKAAFCTAYALQARF